MSFPRELASKVFRHVEPDAQPQTPNPAPVHETITRHEYREDGSVQVVRFDPVHGERTEEFSADDAPLVQPPAPTMTPEDRLAVEQQLHDAGVRR